MSDQQRIFIFGAGGHAKVVLDIVERRRSGVVVEVFDDDPAKTGQMLLGYRVAGGRNELLKRGAKAGLVIVAIGGNPARRSVAAWLASQGFAFASAIHPAAQIGREVRITAGSVVMAGTAINPDTVIGMHCIVNSGGPGAAHRWRCDNRRGCRGAEGRARTRRRRR